MTDKFGYNEDGRPNMMTKQEFEAMEESENEPCDIETCDNWTDNEDSKCCCYIRPKYCGKFKPENEYKKNEDCRERYDRFIEKERARMRREHRRKKALYKVIGHQSINFDFEKYIK
jgi:hypothetical protein